MEVPLPEVEDHPTEAVDRPTEVEDHLLVEVDPHTEEEAPLTEEEVPLTEEEDHHPEEDHLAEVVELHKEEAGHPPEEVPLTAGQRTLQEEQPFQEDQEVPVGQEVPGGQEALEVAGYLKQMANGTPNFSYWWPWSPKSSFRLFTTPSLNGTARGRRPSNGSLPCKSSQIRKATCLTNLGIISGVASRKAPPSVPGT